jgi:pSer/pThr/pTyr-binding forkhead associated (FHA) protein
MDESVHTNGSALPFQGPHRPAQHAEGVPADFLPLRLLLQPGNMVIELNRVDMLVGRHSEADIRLPLPDVSRRHCRFLFGNGHWVVMDLNSLNGVFVNDEPVAHATLKQGDRVRIGGYIFAVDLSREHHPAATEGAPNLTQGILQIRGAFSTFIPRRRAS